MAITYKDINDFVKKPSISGLEKLPVSDTEYITPDQIVAGVDSKFNQIVAPFFTEEIRSKFVLHYTHAGDGTYSPHPARNAITTPLKYDDDVTVSVTSGHKFAIQFYDGYQAGSSHLIQATGWITSDYTIPAGSYWCIIVANSDDSATTDATTDSLNFSGIADGGLILDDIDNIKNQIGDIETILASI